MTENNTQPTQAVTAATEPITPPAEQLSPAAKPVAPAAKPEASSTKHLWLNSFMVLFFLMVFFGGYYLYLGEATNLRTLNKVLAAAGTITIGLSYSLTALAYYFNFLDTKVAYKKYLGLVGFFAVFAHFVVSLYLIPLEIFLKDRNLNAFLFGLTSLLILVAMAIVSNKTAVKQLGGKNWKRVLRLGYLSYLLALAHYFLRGVNDWEKWIDAGFISLPPASLLVALFSVYVLISRLMLSLSLLKKKLLKSE